MDPKSDKVRNWDRGHEHIAELLKRRLRKKRSCQELIDGYEEMMGAIWDFVKRLLGDAGARAVIARSIQQAGKKAPLVNLLVVTGNAVEFGPFREEVNKLGCSSADVLGALTQLGMVIFDTLAELAGEALTEPLFRALEEETD